jgi:hypothetical protein
MGKLDFGKLMKSSPPKDQASGEVAAPGMAKKLATWMSDFMKGRNSRDEDNPKRGGPPARADQYVRLIGKLPSILKFVPSAGRLGDIKNYLLLFGYFLQPTPNNIRGMLLHAIKNYVPGDHHSIKIEPAEALPIVGTIIRMRQAFLRRSMPIKSGTGRSAGELLSGIRPSGCY